MSQIIENPGPFKSTEGMSEFVDADISGVLTLPLLPFTPTIKIGAGGPTSYTTQFGRATRIADRILFDLHVVINVKGATTGAVRIGGLPVPSSAVAGALTPVLIKVNGISLAAGWVGGYIDVNSSEIVLQINTFAVPIGNANMTEATLLDACEFIISGQYRY